MKDAKTEMVLQQAANGMKKKTFFHMWTSLKSKSFSKKTQMDIGSASSPSIKNACACVCVSAPTLIAG